MKLHEELNLLRREMMRWVEDHSGAIAMVPHSSVEGLSDRASDNWLPLLAIADVLGGTWPKKAQEAAASLSGPGTVDNESIRVELLTDIRKVFDGTYVPNGKPVDRLSSADLCNFLTLMEERPWGTWKHGKPMTPVQLARVLKPFRVSSRTVRLEGQGTPRGYLTEDFTDAFTRYIPSTPQDSALSKCNSATTRSQSGDHTLFQGATDDACCTFENGLNPAPRAECVTVAFQNGISGAEETLFEETLDRTDPRPTREHGIFDAGDP